MVTICYGAVKKVIRLIAIDKAKIDLMIISNTKIASIL